MLADSTPSFCPAAFLSHPQLQTIVGFLVPGNMPSYRATPRIVTLDDGDRLVVHDDQPPSWVPGDRIAILVHGLSGCHGSPYMRRSADRLNRIGIRSLRVDLRGCGSSGLISRGHMHAGCSPDLQNVVEFAHQLSPLSPISMIAFSLGGNVMLKLLGDWGKQHPPFVESAIAVAPPIDLQWGSANLTMFGNRIYEYYYMKRLRNELARRRRLVNDLVDNGCHPLPRRLVHFDDQFVAPVSGFRGAREYYANCSAAPLLQRIAVPTILLCSRDDPIVPFEMIEQAKTSNRVKVVGTDRGGHLGFVGRKTKDPDRHWMEWRICQWISGVDGNRGPLQS